MVSRRAAAAATMVLLGLSGCARDAGAPSARGRSSVATLPDTTLPATTPAPTAVAATPSPPVSPTPAACSPSAALATWSLRRLAAQTVVVPVLQTDVASIAAEVAAGAGGIVLLGDSTPPDLAAQLARLEAQAPGRLAPLVMTDEEGGAVQRMADVAGWVPSARQMGLTMTAAQIQDLAFTVGRRLRAAGVTMDLAPVVDLDAGPGPSATDPDGTRSFSADPAVAAADGTAFAIGLERAGVVPVLKHFPGLGGATANPDDAPAATLSWSALQHGALLPFERAIAAGAGAVMVADASVPGLTSGPASLSAAVLTGVVRDQLRFRGLVLTDSLSAAAVADAGYSVPGAAVAALAAGADMVLFKDAVYWEPTVDAIVSAVGAGTLSRARLEDAVLHVLATKGVDLCS